MPKTTASLVGFVGCCAAAALVPIASNAQTTGTTASLQTERVGERVTIADLAAHLRHLVGAEEQYFREHGSYTTDLAALHLWDLATQNRSWLQVVYAGGRSWRRTSCSVGPGQEELCDLRGRAQRLAASAADRSRSCCSGRRGSAEV